jgi:amino acid transporter
VLLALVAAVALAQGHAEPARAFEFKHGRSVLLATLGGAALAFYALEDSVNVAEETIDPPRTYPKALFGGLAIRSRSRTVSSSISAALLTQIEAATYARAAVLVSIGVTLWVVNWLVLRRRGEAMAPPST